MISRYGTMHIVATNIILWIRTLIKETMEEVSISLSTIPKKLDHFDFKNIYLLEVKLYSFFLNSFDDIDPRYQKLENNR